MKMIKKFFGIYVFNKWGLIDKVDMIFGGRIEKI